MLTVMDLSDMTGKPIATIRYWITHDKKFVKRFWVKKEVKLYNSRGFYYSRDVWMCKDSDIDKITEYLDTRQPYKSRKRYWTDIAIHCYERKMLCTGCCFQVYCSKFTHPPMKSKVLENVRLYGEPNNDQTV